MSEPAVNVYGVIAAADDVALPDGTRRIAHGDVAAVVGDAADGQVMAARAVREHWRILEALAARTTVLPVRFGTAMSGDAAVVEQYLGPQHDGLAARLSELAGTVQLTVKGHYDGDAMLRAVVNDSPAIARLRAEVAQLPEAAAYAKRIRLGELVAAEVERTRERDGARVLKALEPHALAARLEPSSGPEAGVNAAFLVRRDQIDDFSRAVTRLGEELGEHMRLRYLGPLPPYSFTDADASAGVGAWA
jgi:Gas vesicle synthesis protein GvpL/GvpF